MLEELIVNAAIGTSRRVPTFSAVSPAIDDALGALSEESPEAKLLGAVGILTRYGICGRLPKPVSAAPDPAEEESLPACSRRAGELLNQVLAMPNNETKIHLIDEWLENAMRRGRRTSHRLLPALLDYGAGRKAARHGITQVAGARGRWLMRFNPQWRFDVDDRQDPAPTWSTGTRDQRLAVLRRLRESNAAAARDLIHSTWKEDAAEDRSMFVAAMITSLGDEDEPFLESCLDDRSKQVRSSAADLLARLPRSAYVRRMIERADPLLKFTAAVKGGLLRKAVAACIEVSLPPETFSPDWARDGVVEKPDERIGRRQWWLQQFLAAIPPIHWSAKWNISPAECVAAAGGEFEGTLLAAWHLAAARHPDPAWIAALLLAAKEGRGPMTFELLNHLPQDARQAITCELLESSRLAVDGALQLLRAADFSLDRHSAAALFRLIERHLAQQPAGAGYIVTPILQLAALRIPPSLYDDLSARCSGATWEPARNGLDDFFLTLLIRRDIQREFNP